MKCEKHHGFRSYHAAVTQHMLKQINEVNSGAGDKSGYGSGCGCRAGAGKPKGLSEENYINNLKGEGSGNGTGCGEGFPDGGGLG